MTAEVFVPFLTLAVVFFWLGLPLVQGLVLAEVRRRGGDAKLLQAAGMREHVLRSVLRATRLGGMLVLLAWAGWLLLARPSPGWVWGLGAEILVAFLVLQLGLAMVTVRFTLQYAGGESPSPRGFLAIRAGVLAFGWIYGLALWVLMPGGAGETLFVLVILGLGMGMLGLNQILRMPRDRLARYAGLLSVRR